MDEKTFEKIEMLMYREDLSYEEAQAILEKFNGDIIEALIHCERERQKSSKKFNEKLSESEFVTYIKGLIKSGNISRIIIRKEESILVNIPVNAGIVVGIVMLLQPVLIVLGTATAVCIDLEIDIVKEDGSIEVINKIVRSKVETSAKKATKVGHELKDGISATYDKIKDAVSKGKNK